jgi:hypothetical protein
MEVLRQRKGKGMEPVTGKNFTIVDPQDMRTLAFLVNKNEETSEDAPQYTLQKLDCAIQIDGEKTKKTFFINESIPDSVERDVVLLTVGKEKALLNTAILQNDKLFVSKSPAPLEYRTMYSDKPVEYKDFKYTPNFKRPISIIDPEIGDEVRPVLYFDSKENMVKGKIKLMPYKAYIALEVKE